MSEIEERPQIIDCVREGPECAHRELKRYLESLIEREWIDADTDLDTAIAMLMGAIFGDAMGREMMPDNFPQPVAAAPGRYARFLLGAVGFRSAGRTRTAAAKTPPAAGVVQW